MTEKTKQPFPFIAVVSVAVGVAAALAMTLPAIARVGEESSALVTLIVGVLVAAAIVGITFWHVVGSQKAQQRALRARFPEAIVFGSCVLATVRAVVRGAARELGFRRPRGLTFGSPTVTVAAGGVDVWYGGRNPKPSYRIPRDIITGVTVAAIQEGAYAYPCLGILVESGGEELVFPIPVTRGHNALRRETPEGTVALAESIAKVLGLGDGGQ